MVIKILLENRKAFVLLFISTSAMFGATYMFFSTGGTSLTLFIAKIISIAVFFFALRHFIRILDKYGIKPLAKIKQPKVVRALFRLLFTVFIAIGGAITKKIDSILEKLTTRGLSPRLRRYHDERMTIAANKTRLTSRLRKLKWRSLTTNRDRIRFLYIAFLKKQIKKGAPVQMSDTPNELCAKLQAHTDTLFELYNRARYTQGDAISDEEVTHARRR